MSTSLRRQRGVTIIELIMFIVIIGAALAGLVQVMSLTTKTSADPMRQKQALMIAEGLLEEVRLSAFTFCEPTDVKVETARNAGECTVKEEFGAIAGEAGRPYDNINDYVDQAGVAKAAFNNADGKLIDSNGNAMGVEGYSATVTISPVALNGVGAAGASADTDVLRITINVSYDGQVLALDGYRTRYAPNFP
jgi:MSHA pilin protein MshD